MINDSADRSGPVCGNMAFDMGLIVNLASPWGKLNQLIKQTKSKIWDNHCEIRA